MADVSGLARRVARRLRGGPPPSPAKPPVDPAARVARARAHLQAGRTGKARAMAARLRARPATADVGAVVAAIVAYDRGFPALAHAELAGLPPATAAALAPAEWVRSGLAEAPEETEAAVRALAAEDPPGLGPRAWYELLAATFGAGEQELARAVFARFDECVARDPEAWPDAARHRDSLRDWVAADPGSPSAPPPGGRRTIAIMDYGHPGADRASANLGDHVQSIAALGHLVRHRGVRLHGRDELTAVLRELGGRVRPERARHDVEADVEVMTVHRDASMYRPIPEDTWVLCFGWYMHAIFTTRFGFPLHDNLRPIFVSFHCNKRDLLTPEAIAYLQRYGPVGCRDWTTVHLLQSCGVPAFFSGCLTTTIDTVFPDADTVPPDDAPPAYVDIPPEDVPPGATVYKHSNPAVRRRSFVRNVGDALALLETYRTQHREVVTSRLHCYLPVRSIGMDVDFRPHNRADVRFDGLMDIDDAAFAAIRDGMLERLERVHAAILSGAPEEDVYRLWRDLAADDVLAAEARRARPPALPAPDPAHAAAADRAVAATVHTGAAGEDAVHVAVPLPAGGGAQLAELVRSLLEHASRPLHLWVLARPGEAARERLVARFPGLAISWVPLRGIRPKRLRLQLPALLPGVYRVVLLPLPSVATGDIAELAELDLGGHAFAAPLRPGTNWISGFGVIHAAGNRLGDRPEVASELRRTAHARHRFDFDSFRTGVLVADLARLREEPLLAVADAYGLDDRETLHWIAGPDRATVPARWAYVPTRMRRQPPGLAHFADGKPPGAARAGRTSTPAG
ncbi:MAG: hypothetical protein ABW060_17345 [Solirubrobacteraceae bacterium]